MVGSFNGQGAWERLMDGHMVQYKGKSIIRQHMKNKPYGIDVFQRQVVFMNWTPELVWKIILILSR